MQREIAFLDSLQGRGIRPGLGRMRRFLRAVGNPHRAVPAVIVAGTNGKGSTAATIASILVAAGYRTGFYTSPHLVSLLERWRIDGRELAPHAFERSVARLREVMTRESIELTYFEALTAIAFLSFAEARCDVMVLEVGMGGRLDATNVVRPLVSVVTSIGLDHTEYLGTTLRQIAREKAGVIHRGARAVTSNRRAEVVEVLARRSAAFDVSLRRSWRGSRASAVESSLDGTAFRLETPRGRYQLRSPLAGDHQVENITLAVCAAEELSRSLKRITAKSIEEGVRTTAWRGRLELFRADDVVVVVDGAHNGHAAARIAAFVDAQLPRPRALVFGVMHDKDVEMIASILVPLFDEVIVTEPDPVRATRTAQLAAVVARFEVPVFARRMPAAALRFALERGPASVLVAGSLYLAGEALKFLDRHAASAAAASVSSDRVQSVATRRRQLPKRTTTV